MAKGKCKYCNRVTSNYGKICSHCYTKLKAWRELYALACYIKKLAGK